MKIGDTVIIIDGFNPKLGRKVDDYDKYDNYLGTRLLPEIPYHSFEKGQEVKIIGKRREEYLVEYKDMKQHVKRRFINNLN